MRSKGEELIVSAIKKLFGNTQIVRQYGIGSRLTLDVYLPSYKIGIEYDGIQHFEEVKFFHETHMDFLNQKARDLKKDDACRELGITLIRIPYTDNINADIICRKIIDCYNPQKEKQREPSRSQPEKYKPKRSVQYKNKSYKRKV